MDGMGSIAGSEEDKVRIRPAVNRDTGQTAGTAFGDRSGETCLLLWKSLPPDYRKHAVIYADYWEACKNEGGLKSERLRRFMGLSER
jgi:IS1 family transposase